MAEYSTPLYKKLGIKEGSRVLVLNGFDQYLDFFSDFPADVLVEPEPVENETYNMIHLFCRQKSDFHPVVFSLKKYLDSKGALWVSWSKKSSGFDTDLHRDYIIETGLETGLVDTKVASVNSFWSAIKFVHRLKDRV
jgi:hypothetical protein